MESTETKGRGRRH